MDDEVCVSLTTTKHIAAAMSDPEELKRANTPIMAVSMCSPLISSIPRMGQLVLEMAKEIYVDSSKKYVYVGESHLIEESSLVEYTETGPSIYAEDFFKQWDEMEMIVFELVMLDPSGLLLFVLRGLWDIDKWDKLEINRGKPRFNILRKPASLLGTFSTHSLGKRGLDKNG